MVLAGYRAHLARSPLAPATRRAYECQARGYLGWLSEQDDGGAEALVDRFARDYAVRDYRLALKDRRLAPASVNAAVDAVAHFSRFLGLDAPRVPRDVLPKQAPRALSDEELRRVLRAAERRGNARDRAAVALMAFAGLRVSEVAGLDTSDLALSARKGLVMIRYGKGEVSRTVPLGIEARAALAELLRIALPEPRRPLFTNRAGKRLSIRSLHRVVWVIGREGGVKLSPHILRHTFVTRLLRAGTDVVLVAELAGHRSLETTRRYGLPTAEDRARAVEAAAIEY